MPEFIKTSVGFDGNSAEAVFTAATGSDFFVPENADSRVVLIIKNSNTQNATVTFKAGDGALAPLGDAAVTVGAGKTVIVPLERLETARVKVMTGDNRGRVLVTTAVDAGGSLANVSVCVASVK